MIDPESISYLADHKSISKPPISVIHVAIGHFIYDPIEWRFILNQVQRCHLSFVSEQGFISPVGFNGTREVKVTRDVLRFLRWRLGEYKNAGIDFLE